MLPEVPEFEHLVLSTVWEGYGTLRQSLAGGSMSLGEGSVVL